jgi:hypothetical protein
MKIPEAGLISKKLFSIFEVNNLSYFGGSRPNGTGTFPPKWNSRNIIKSSATRSFS